MNTVRITNDTKKSPLGNRIEHAHSIIERVRGLVGRGSIQESGGMWFPKCSSIHTFGMRIPIDVIYLDIEMRIVKVVRSLSRNRLSGCLRAAHVLELPVGTIDKSKSDIGDRIIIV